MNKRIKASLNALAVLSAAICLTSCIDEILGAAGQRASGDVGVNVSGTGNYAVKSSSPHSEELIGSGLIGDPEEDAFKIEVYEAENGMMPLTCLTKIQVHPEEEVAAEKHRYTTGCRTLVPQLVGAAG